MDGMIIGITALAGRSDNLAVALRRSLEAVFPDDAAKVTAVLEGYSIDESKDDRLPILNFINDIVFALGAKSTAQAWARAASRLDTKAYLTHFNMPNPWDGPWQGHASHAFDTATLLGNYNEFFGDGQKACSEKMAADLIAFASGKEPFPPYSGESGGTAMVYYAGVSSKEDVSNAAIDSDESGTGRRSILDQVAAGNPEVLDKLLGAFSLLLQGPK